MRPPHPAHHMSDIHEHFVERRELNLLEKDLRIREKELTHEKRVLEYK